MEIRALRESDERSRFRSGDPDLDRYFHRFAGQNQLKHYVGVTYVAVDGGEILGFATVSPGQVEIDALPMTERRKLPSYPLPILRLARLAVDVSVQGQGLGTQLLRFVIKLAASMANDYGCVGLLVDAKADAIKFYATYGFLVTEPLEGQSEVRPRETPMFLGMRAIRLSLK